MLKILLDSALELFSLALAQQRLKSSKVLSDKRGEAFADTKEWPKGSTTAEGPT